VAAKNHHHGTLNPKAQFRFEVPVEAVLADKPVIAPLTRSMCAPISDGAAGAILCSRAWLEQQDKAIRDRAVLVRACALAGGRYRDLGQSSVVERAAQRAYSLAGIQGNAVQLAEVHDATSACELLHYEALGFCGRGESGPYAESGATALGGARPVNLSGGLVSKGHPLGATGLGQLDELVVQLRGEAGPRQAPGQPTLAVAQNAGGAIGWDEALCAVTVLERA
jgi:acetyl-CoA acetyltransferase